MFLIKCVHTTTPLHCFVSVPAVRGIGQTKQSVKPFDVFCTPIFLPFCAERKKRLFFIVAGRVCSRGQAVKNWGGQIGKKIIDLPGGKINDPSTGIHYSPLFLPATSSSLSQTLEVLFELTH